MKSLAFALLGLLCAGGAAAASTTPTNPFPTANCGFTSKADLQGDTVALTVGTDSAILTTLPFAPQSVYVADGYAVKFFKLPKFSGEGFMVGGAVYGGDNAVAGGKYNNFSTWSDYGTIASATCVKAGVPFPNDSRNLLYYNDRYFTISGYRSNGLGVSITFKDGKKLVQYFNNGSSRYGNDQQVLSTLDLDTNDITLKSPGSEQVYHRAFGNDLEAMAYVGAAAKLAAQIDSVIPNSGNWPTPAYTIPYLELQPVVKYLRNFAAY